MEITRILPLLLIPLVSVPPLHADVTVNKMFSDHMVLQRDLSVPVWGTASPDEAVTVAFRGQTKQATADKDGKWIIKLDPLQVGEASALSVTGKNSVSFKDVLVGEVWVGSGQSNMAGKAGQYAKNDPVLTKNIQSGPYPTLRLYAGGSWKVADSTTIPGFSAIHFSFGQALHEELKVPVGLMVGAVGGTPSGRWLSSEMAMADKSLVAKLGSMEEQRTAYAESVKVWEARAATAKAEGKKAPRKPRGPIRIGDLYERNVQPFVPYGIRGVLWDQGESKTALPNVDQYTTMNALINGWRQVWGQGDFHFLHVQKPSGGGPAWDTENPVNRLAVAFNAALPGSHVTDPAAMHYQLQHIKIGTLKNAPLVTASDLGPGIHPANKSGYGKRACRVALGTVYGHDVAVCGPVYKSHKSEGDKLRVTFDHIGQGLAFRHGERLLGFEIAGADNKWVWAEATIDGDTVLLHSKDVKQPTQVQYAFQKKINFANLFNKDGLPALTFTTAPE